MNTQKYNLLALFVLLCFAACKTNDAFELETDSKAGAQIFIAKANRGTQNLTIFPYTDDAREFTFGAGYGALGLPANNISIKFSVDQKALDSINAIRLNSALPPYEKFPADAYQVGKLEVTIPKGGMSSDLVSIKYFSKKFSSDKSYCLPLTITDASGYTISPMAKTIFIVAPKLEEVPATTTGWIATASTEQVTGESTGLASALIDGNLATIWHSRYSPLPRSSYPHWLNFDMLQPIYVTKVAIAARQNNANGFTKFKLEGTLDGTNWILLGDNLAFDPAVKSFQEYPITRQYLRQIRATLLEGKQDLTFMAEFTVYRY
ncbi:BT_3987 domain-containing protein [Pedobacter africanus]|uniref:F5/8 type C domain-containing protein n=1 Tax=Pedobacter africanus TaxID=151894 RepID=A0A1W2CK91_9SPHI|nr:DUF1735 domain-containing protein [Pedobacter africanus]SMC85657.1 protein of unknown function [Pedobacter africanus]